MASVSYDVHLQEIMGALTIGASIVMLHPEGNMDYKYVLKVIQTKQISYMQTVPAYIESMFDSIQTPDIRNLDTLRTLDIGGKHILYIVAELVRLF